MRLRGDQHTPMPQKTDTGLFWDSLPSDPGRVGVACRGAYPVRSRDAVDSVSSPPAEGSQSPLREFEPKGLPFQDWFSQRLSEANTSLRRIGTPHLRDGAYFTKKWSCLL